jgi:hypothetical protein
VSSEIHIVSDPNGALFLHDGSGGDLVPIPDPDGSLKNKVVSAAAGKHAGHYYLILTTMVDGRPTPHYFDVGSEGAETSATPIAELTKLAPMEAQAEGRNRIAFGDSFYQAIDTPADAPFVYTVRETDERQDDEAVYRDANVSNMAIFARDGDDLRPATLAEVRSHFDKVIGQPKPKEWAALPRADRVEIDASGKKVRFYRGSEVLEADIDARESGGKFPSDAQLQRMLADLPFQSLRELHRVKFVFDETALAMFGSDGSLFFSSNEGWLLEENVQAQTRAVPHEVAGHGIEKGDAQLLSLLMEARLLDAAQGAKHGTDGAYGDTDLRESFAVGIEEYKTDPIFRQKRPHFAALLDFIFNNTGAETDRSSLQRVLLAALIPLLLVPAASRNNRPQ